MVLFRFEGERVGSGEEMKNLEKFQIIKFELPKFSRNIPQTMDHFAVLRKHFFPFKKCTKAKSNLSHVSAMSWKTEKCCFHGKLLITEKIL